MLSGDVTQTFNINLGTSSDPAIEKQVLSDHASYGKQLGRIGEALIVLLKRVDLTDMTQDEEKAICDLKFRETGGRACAFGGETKNFPSRCPARRDLIAIFSDLSGL